MNFFFHFFPHEDAQIHEFGKMLSIGPAVDFCWELTLRKGLLMD